MSIAVEAMCNFLLRWRFAHVTSVRGYMGRICPGMIDYLFSVNDYGVVSSIPLTCFTLIHV